MSFALLPLNVQTSILIITFLGCHDLARFFGPIQRYRAITSGSIRNSRVWALLRFSAPSPWRMLPSAMPCFFACHCTPREARPRLDRYPKPHTCDRCGALRIMPLPLPHPRPAVMLSCWSRTSNAHSENDSHGNCFINKSGALIFSRSTNLPYPQPSPFVNSFLSNNNLQSIHLCY